jgi:hypothetical protein
MLTKSKIAVIAAVLGMVSVSSASAQSFNRPEGTGNELPSYYDSQGGLHMGYAPAQSQVAVQRSGLNAFASIGLPVLHRMLRPTRAAAASALPGSRRPVAGQGARPMTGAAASSLVSCASGVER